MAKEKKESEEIKEKIDSIDAEIENEKQAIESFKTALSLLKEDKQEAIRNTLDKGGDLTEALRGVNKDLNLADEALKAAEANLSKLESKKRGFQVDHFFARGKEGAEELKNEVSQAVSTVQTEIETAASTVQTEIGLAADFVGKGLNSAWKGVCVQAIYLASEANRLILEPAMTFLKPVTDAAKTVWTGVTEAALAVAGQAINISSALAAGFQAMLGLEQDAKKTSGFEAIKAAASELVGAINSLGSSILNAITQPFKNFSEAYNEARAKATPSVENKDENVVENEHQGGSFGMGSPS